MAVIGVTSKLEYEAGSAYVEVPGVKSVNFPAFNTSAVDTTSLDNSNFAMSFIPGMIDPASISFECEFSDATYVALSGMIRETTSWRVTAPTGVDTAVTCDGFLVKLDVSISPADEVMISGEVKMTGLPVVS